MRWRPLRRRTLLPGRSRWSGWGWSEVIRFGLLQFQRYVERRDPFTARQGVLNVACGLESGHLFARPDIDIRERDLRIANEFVEAETETREVLECVDRTS